MRRTISDVRAGVIESRAPAILNRRKKVGVIGGKGSRSTTTENMGRIPSGSMGKKRKIIVESIARSKTKMNLRRNRRGGVYSGKRVSGGLSAKISAIVNSIINMITGR